MASEPTFGGQPEGPVGTKMSAMALVCVLIILAGTIVALMVLFGFGAAPNR